jgi:hypothetical protein
LAVKDSFILEHDRSTIKEVIKTCLKNPIGWIKVIENEFQIIREIQGDKRNKDD